MSTLTLVSPVARDAATPPVHRRPLPLPRGALLRVDRARGVVVRAAGGRIWITEEGRALDVVLGAGDAHRLTGRGRAVVAAEQASRVVLEWAQKRPAPRIEVADGEGEPGRPIDHGRPRFAALLARVLAWWNAPPAPRGGAPAARARRPLVREDVTPDAVRDRLAGHVPLLRS